MQSLFKKIVQMPAWFKIMLLVYAVLVVTIPLSIFIWSVAKPQALPWDSSKHGSPEFSETYESNQQPGAVNKTKGSAKENKNKTNNKSNNNSTKNKDSNSTVTGGNSKTVGYAVETSKTSANSKSTGCPSGKTRLYSAHGGMKSSGICKVAVNGEDCFVYETNVNFRRVSPNGNASDVLQLEKTPVAYFDLEGSALVTVTLPEKVTSAIVTPRSSGIKATVNGNRVEFTVSKAGQYTVEFNDSVHKALHLFVNPIESNPPAQSSDNLLYYGSGIHDVGAVYLKSNQSVYIAGGAVVRGWFVGNYVENVKIYGRGIVDGSIYPRYGADGKTSAAHPPIQFSKAKKVSVDGIIFLDPAGWTINTYHCTDVTINNVKIISSRQNGDGITTQSCTNQKVTNCFVRSWDDSLVVKAYEGNTKNISFNNCIIWTDLAQSCEVGYETRGDIMEDITFSNITVLHNFHKAVLSVHNGDHATVRNVRFENIVIEDAQMGTGDGSNYLIDILIGETIWSKENVRGKVENVYFNNINVLGGKFPGSRIYGYSKDHMVKGVNIKNITILGRKISSLADGKLVTNEYVSNIVFE